MCTNKITTLAALQIAAARRSLNIKIFGVTGRGTAQSSFSYEICGENGTLLFRLEHAPSREGALSHLDDTLGFVLHAHANCPGDLTRAEKTKLVEWLKGHDEARGFELLPM